MDLFRHKIRIMGLFENEITEKKKIEVCIVIYDDEVIYDVENLVDKGIRVKKQLDASSVVEAQQAEYENAQDRSILMRSLARGKGKLRNLLTSYLVDNGTYAKDNTLKEEKSHTIFCLSFPCNWKRGLLDALKEEIHEYLVRSVLSDFERNTMPENSQIDFALADDSRSNILGIIHKRNN